MSKSSMDNLDRAIDSLANEFSNVMDVIKTLDSDVNDMIMEKYPFPVSFYRVRADVLDWTKLVRKKIRIEKNKNKNVGDVTMNELIEIMSNHFVSK